LPNQHVDVGNTITQTNSQRKSPKAKKKALKKKLGKRTVSHVPNISKRIVLADNTSQEIERFVIALLSAEKFILPRAVPTRVYMRSFKRVINIADCVAASVLIRPTLSKPIIVCRQLTAASSVSYSLEDGAVNGWAGVNGVNMDVSLLGATNTLKPITYDGGSLNSALVFHDDGTYDVVRNENEHQYMYAGAVTAFNGYFTVSGPNLLNTNDWNLTLAAYTTEFVLVGTKNAIKVTAGNVTTYTMDGPIPVGSFFTLQFTPASASGGASITSMDFSSSPWSLSVTTDLSFSAYDPIESNEYQTLLDNTQRFTITAQSLLMQNTQSSLADGGNIYIATATGDYPMALAPALSQTQIVTFNPDNYYSGQLRKGAHGSYMPEDISGYFFKDNGSSQYDRNSLGTPKLIATAIGPAGANVSLMVTVRMNYEYIAATQVYESLLSNSNITFLTEALGALRAAEYTGGANLFGENPDHIAKIRRIAKQVASNPKVQAAARAALKTGVEATKVMLPALATIL